MGAEWGASLVMATWSHVRAALWGGDPLQFGQYARCRRSCPVFGAQWLVLDPAALSLPHVSSGAAFMISPIVSKSATKDLAHSSRLQENRGIMRF